MRYLLIFIGVATLMASCRKPVQNTPDDILTISNPEEEGLAEDRINRISAMLEQAVSDQKIPGGVALIARNGKVVYHNAFGMSDTQKGLPFEKDAIFRIASQTKAITATAVMMLWEEGKFRLDDPISDYIPEFEKTGVLESFKEADSSFTVKPLEKPITIRHLLTHTSGIGYGMIDGDARIRKAFAKAGIIDAFTAEEVTLAENIPELARMPLHHEPGAGWTYSEGLDVLGRFVEIISGQTFDAFLEERIFRPLGMKDTWFYLPAEKAARLVPVQHKTDNGWAVFSTSVFDINYPVSGARAYFAGGAGLSSTAADYAAFLQMYLNNGVYNGNRLLSRTTVEMMMQNQIGDLWSGGPSDYGIAFAVVNEQGVRTGGQGGLGTFEWGGYFNTSYFADPGEEIIGILMKQTQNLQEDNTGWKFRQMVFAAIDD